MFFAETPDGPVVEGAGPSLLRELLGEFEAELRSRGARVDDLAPGRDRDDIRAQFDAAGLPAPDEAVEWFAWHDGINEGAPPARPSDPIPLLEAWSLDYALSKRRRIESLGLMGTDAFQRDPRWFQILGDSWGLIMSMSRAQSAPPLIRGMEFSSPNTAPDFTEMQVVSLCTPVAWWIEDMRNGVLVWNTEWRGWDWDHLSVPAQRRAIGLG